MGCSHRKARGLPGLKAPDDIGRVNQTELLEGCGGEARLVALVADQDYPGAGVGDGLVPPGGRRVAAPFHDVARDESRPRDHAVAFALDLRADVDQERARPRRGLGLGRGQTTQTGARLRQQLLGGCPLGQEANSSTTS